MDYTNGLLSNEDRIAELEAQLENRKSFVRRAAELEGLLNEANKLIMEHCDQDDRIAALQERYELLQTKYQLDVVQLRELLADWQERAHRVEAELAEAKQNTARLERELAAITHVAMTADPAGWWIAPRGSSDPIEWICVEEMDDEAKEES